MQRLERTELNALTGKVIGAAIEVHKYLGPGLLESAYESCLAHELVQQGLKVNRQVAIPIVYKDLQVEQGYRLDLLVEDAVIVELKAVEALNDIHSAQVLSYLKFSGYQIGLLINFNVMLLKLGIKRFAN